jgi:hypothetical protein
MDAVKEAVLEQKIDDLSLRFDGFEARFELAEERNHREHREIREEIGGLRTEVREQFGGLRTEVREEIGGLRTEMNEGFRELRATMTAFNRTMLAIFGSVFGTAVAGLVVAAAVKLF